jgi:hypothetical protein
MVETKVERLKMVERLRRIKTVGQMKIFNNSTSKQFNHSTNRLFNLSTTQHFNL